MSRCKECHKNYGRDLNIKNSAILMDSALTETLKIKVELLVGEAKEHSQVSNYKLNEHHLIISHIDDRTIYIYPVTTIQRIIIQS